MEGRVTRRHRINNAKDFGTKGNFGLEGPCGSINEAADDDKSLEEDGKLTNSCAMESNTTISTSLQNKMSTGASPPRLLSSLIDLASPPIGFIQLTDDTHVSFGILPPASEAKAVPSPDRWKEIKVCPPLKFLALPLGKLTCHAEFCKEKVQSLESHVKKHLNSILEEQWKRMAATARLNENCDLPKSLEIKYYCYESTCYNGLPYTDGSKGFTKMKYLRQHYLKLHAAKTFGCSSCNKSFATLGLLGSHMKSCGNSFSCATCNKKYNTLESLQTHCRRHDHGFDYSKYKEKIDKSKQEISVMRQAEQQLKEKLLISKNTKRNNSGKGTAKAVTAETQTLDANEEAKLRLTFATAETQTFRNPNTCSKGSDTLNFATVETQTSSDPTNFSSYLDNPNFASSHTQTSDVDMGVDLSMESMMDVVTNETQGLEICGGKLNFGTSKNQSVDGAFDFQATGIEETRHETTLNSHTLAFLSDPTMGDQTFSRMISRENSVDELNLSFATTETQTWDYWVQHEMPRMTNCVTVETETQTSLGMISEFETEIESLNVNPFSLNSVVTSETQTSSFGSPGTMNLNFVTTETQTSLSSSGISDSEMDCTF